MTEPTYHCDLCRLPVEAEGYVLHTRDSTLHFCCEGCQGIYRMLHEDEIVDSPTPPQAG